MDQQTNEIGSLYNISNAPINFIENLHFRAVGGLRLITTFFQILFEVDANFLRNLPPDNKIKTLMSYTLKIGFDY